MHLSCDEAAQRQTAPGSQSDPRGRRKVQADARAQSSRAWRSSAASTTARAVMFTSRRTVAEGVRMCTAFAAPSRMGPMDTPSPLAVFTKLKAMLAASRFGITIRLASPLRVESGWTLLRISMRRAESACISPSHSRSGRLLFRISRAAFILRAEAERELPKLEEHTSELQSPLNLV